MKQPPRRLFEDEDRSGFAFREIFTPNREGPLPQRPHPSGKGGSSLVKPKASVWSTADAATNGMTLTNGGRTITPSGLAAWRSIRSSTSRTAGKLYIEFAVSGSIDSGINILFGLASSGFNIGSFLGDSNYSGGTRPTVANYASVGFTNTADATLSAAAVTNDVWALAVDFAAGNIWLARNNTWQAGGNPGLGSSPMMTFILATVGSLSAAMTFQGNPGVWTVQPNPASQKYLPPVGFQAWDGGPITPVGSVWSAADATTNSMTLTNGGRTVTGSGGVWASVRGSTSKTSGKLYVEFFNSAVMTNNYAALGFASSGFNAASAIGSNNYSGGSWGGGTPVSSGFVSNYVTTLPAPAQNDVWALAIDFAAGRIWIARNNTWSDSSSPVVGTLPIISFTPATVGALFPCLSLNALGSGVWTIQPGPASQTYLPPIGFQAWDGGPVTPTPPAATAALNAIEANNTLTSAGAVTSPQSLAYLARTVGGNEGGNAVNIATLINGLVADGVWANLDVLYVFAQQNATDAALNLIGPTYNATVTTAGTFTAYRGLTGFQYDSGFNPTTAPSPHHTLNLASIGIWSNCSPQEGISQIGNTALTTINTWHTDGNFVIRINNSSTSGAASPAAEGLFGGDRANANNLDPVFNGVYRTNKSGPTPALGNATFTIGKYSTGALTLQTIRAAYIGGSLGATLNLALYNRLRTYLTAVGSP